jgi:hypothetical protein
MSDQLFPTGDPPPTTSRDFFGAAPKNSPKRPAYDACVAWRRSAARARARSCST